MLLASTQSYKKSNFFNKGLGILKLEQENDLLHSKPNFSNVLFLTKKYF